MSEQKSLATAAYLGAFRRELIAEGFEPEEIKQLVLDCAREIFHEQGLCVKDEAKTGGLR